MPRGMEFQVAKATVGDRISMDSLAPSSIHIAAGTRLDIRFDYQLEEMSQEEDLWTFRLDVKIPGKEDSIAQRQHHDRALFADDTLCHVGIDIDFVHPGSHELDYKAHADLSRRPWNQGTEFETIAMDEVEGKVAIHVDEPTE